MENSYNLDSDDCEEEEEDEDDEDSIDQLDQSNLSNEENLELSDENNDMIVRFAIIAMNCSWWSVASLRVKWQAKRYFSIFFEFLFFGKRYMHAFNIALPNNFRPS